MIHTVKDRFLKYVQFDTQADPHSNTSPSSEKQLILTQYLSDELSAMGVRHQKTEHGYIYAYLDSNVDTIYSSEGQLYSNKLKVAGTVDLVGRFKGKPAIIDFKTSINTKKEEWIEGYFLQVSLYSYMVWERTGIMCSDMVVIISIENGSEAQVFEAKVSDWIDKAFTLCNSFHKNYLQAQ